jgi:pimeloyl-ACP methyl ester carboxylesterase
VLQDLRQVVDHYTQDASHPLVIIGHSWGAMYATWFINEHGTYGSRLRGAVLSEPGAFTKAQLDAYMKRLTAGISLFDGQVNDMAWIGQFMSPTDHARADYMMMIQGLGGGWPSAHCDPGNPEPMWRFGAVASRAMSGMADRGFDWTTNLKSFAPLVLFLRGDLNEAARLQDQQVLAAAYANAEIVTMSNVGHCMIWERPTEYLQHVRSYFQAIGFAGGQPRRVQPPSPVPWLRRSRWPSAPSWAAVRRRRRSSTSPRSGPTSGTSSTQAPASRTGSWSRSATATSCRG